MAVLWNADGQNLVLKWNMAIGYVKEYDYKEKDPNEQLKNIRENSLKHPQTSTITVGEVREI